MPDTKDLSVLWQRRYCAKDEHGFVPCCQFRDGLVATLSPCMRLALYEHAVDRIDEIEFTLDSR